MILIYGLVIFSLIVFIHELGHFLFGKIVGVKFITFSVGLGPRLIKKRIGNTIYCLSLLPFGGYVRTNAHKEEHIEENKYLKAIGSFIAPLSDEEAKLAIDLKNRNEVSLESKSSLGFISYILGGSILNILSSIIVLTVYIFLYSPSTSYPIGAKVGKISPYGVASNAGFKEGDKIIEVENVRIYSWGNFLYVLLNSKLDEQFSLKVERESPNGIEELELLLPTKLMKDFDDSYNTFFIYYSKVFGYQATKTYLTFYQAIQNSLITNLKIISSFFSLFFDVSYKSDKANIYKDESLLSSPIRAAFIVGQEASSSFDRAVILFANLSIIVGILNLFPIPAADGCQLLVFMIERLCKVRVSYKQKVYISYIGLLIILSISIVTFLHDIIRGWI